MIRINIHLSAVLFSAKCLQYIMLDRPVFQRSFWNKSSHHCVGGSKPLWWGINYLFNHLPNGHILQQLNGNC